eukprot:488944-Rhodomonas_salina.1
MAGTPMLMAGMTKLIAETPKLLAETSREKTAGLHVRAAAINSDTAAVFGAGAAISGGAAAVFGGGAVTWIAGVVCAELAAQRQPHHGDPRGGWHALEPRRAAHRRQRSQGLSARKLARTRKQTLAHPRDRTPLTGCREDMVALASRRVR